MGLWFVKVDALLRVGYCFGLRGGNLVPLSGY